MSVDMFTTRKMMGIVEEGRKTAYTWLRDRYFANHRTFDTEVIDFDIVGKGGRKIAPFVHPQVGGKVMDREGFQTKSYKAPELSPERITTAEDVLKRSPGETIYSGKTPAQRAAELLGRDLADLDEYITRAEEVMCAKALFEGQLTISGDGYNGEVINFWPTAEGEKPYTELTTKWTADETTALTILKDLRNLRREMIQKSGITPTEIIVGKDVADAIIDKLAESKALDTRRVDLGQINISHLPNGVTYVGYLKDSNLDVYTYDEWYLDKDGAEKPMVPADKILMGSPNVKTTLAYGMVSLINEKTEEITFVVGERVPASWVQRKAPSGRVVQIKSRPLPIVNQVYGFHVIKAV